MGMRNQYGKTKIVLALGPASSTVDVIEKMVRAGMDVARLNFSHGTHEEHYATMKAVREAAGRAGEPIAILQDLQGPKIRTGKLSSPEVRLLDGAKFTITINEITGNAERVSTTYKIAEGRKTRRYHIDGRRLASAQGAELTATDVVSEPVHGGILKEHKGINLPGVAVSAPSLTEKDIEDLEFGIANDIDYVALSFVRTGDDIRHLREFIISKIDNHKKLPIIAKIEKREALDNIDEIIREADAIMVARATSG